MGSKDLSSTFLHDISTVINDFMQLKNGGDPFSEVLSPYLSTV